MIFSSTELPTTCIYTLSLHDALPIYAGAFISMGGFGEVLPRYESHVDLDPEVKDGWGIPVLRFHYQFSDRSEEHTSELQSLRHLVCRLLLEKKKNNY